MFSSSQRVKRLQGIIEKDGFNQAAHYMLGEEYLREDRPVSAVNKFRRVVELNPDHGAAWNMMARAYEAAGVSKEAAVAYREAARAFTRAGETDRAAAATQAAEASARAATQAL